MVNQPTGTWDSEQIRMAHIIINVGLQMGMSQRDIRVGLMTAMQESGLRNLNYGDSDSLGLFQQRPSQGWGTTDQVTDPEYASRKFFSALQGISGRGDMSLTQAAQAVQRSAYPDAYAKWANDAAHLMNQIGIPGGGADGGGQQDGGGFQALTGTPVPQSVASTLHPVTEDVALSTPGLGSAAESVLGVGTNVAPTSTTDLPFMPQFNTQQAFKQAVGSKGGAAGWRQDIVDYAKKFIGTPYVWGGTKPDGFDCSGLTQYVYDHFGFSLPRISADQGRNGKRINLDQLKPGDLVFWDNSSRNVGADHVAIYIGHGQIIEAPRPGLSVQVSGLYDQNVAWGVRMRGGMRG